MSAQNAIDMRHGRRGGGWATGPRPSLQGRPCDKCGEPMIAGQRDRHFVCDPLSIVGTVCVCPPDCSDKHWGDGLRACDPECAPCRIKQGQKLREEQT